MQRNYASFIKAVTSQHADGIARVDAAPDGTLLLARIDGAAAGRVAVRRVVADACEMKRLYVRPAFQGQGVGRALAERAIAWACAAGFERMLCRGAGV